MGQRKTAQRNTPLGIVNDADSETHRREKPRFDVEKGIDELVGVFTDPIIVYPGGGWEETIPEWIKQRITLDRLIMNMKVLHGEEPTATDSEALAYMYPASLCFPLDHDWSQIYLYLSTQVCGAEGKTIPDDIRVDTLTRNQEADLRRLKDWIYQRRITARLEKARAERRQRGEEEAERRKAEQPALFTF